MTNPVVAVVGMSGSGKSELAAQFARAGFGRVRFGDVTDTEVAKRGLALNEANERRVREELRAAHGPTAYATLNLPRIDAALREGPVAVDGLYSWEEYRLLKERYGDRLCVVAVYSSPDSRYARLTRRPVRPLTEAEAAGRDRAEIENLNKGGPIAMADFTVVNEDSLEQLGKAAERIIRLINDDREKA